MTTSTTPYLVLLALIGAVILVTPLLRRAVARRPASLPMIYLAAGMVVFALPIGLHGPRPGGNDQLTERLTELIVVVSVMGAGLKLDRALSWRTWQPTWRLLGLAMPLTIAATAGLGWALLGLPAAAALLLGSAIAPTDPVLASDVQAPGPADHETAVGETRFTLTAEAGLNDGLGFPFTNAAVALAAGGPWLAHWLVADVAVGLAVGVIAGLVLGRALAWLIFDAGPATPLARTGEGFVVLGATLTVFALTELAHGNGFVAVFLAGLTVRNQERHHSYQQLLHDVADTTEQLASIVFLLLLGGALVDGGLGALTVPGAAVAALLVLVVRPLTGWLSLLGTPLAPSDRSAISFLGLRGMGSVFYLAHAGSSAPFPRMDQVWSVTLATIVLSILLHGSTSSALLVMVDRRRQAGGRAMTPA